MGNFKLTRISYRYSIRLIFSGISEWKFDRKGEIFVDNRNKASNTTVVTEFGQINGAFQDGLYVFKGIPYAAPPLGAFRWLPPQPLRLWNDIYQAAQFGPIAPQNTRVTNFTQKNPILEPQSESCLTLNLWTPALDQAKRPVMVWIHGGAFNRGSSSSPTYSGVVLARRGDIVVVTINYRLGALGFLHLDQPSCGHLSATGNEGILDQISALHWVRNNIASFGGDPGNVTVFGESAGAMSIGCLLAMPQAAGFFHKAILESGSNTVKFPDEAVELTRKYLEILGVDPQNAKGLRALSVEQLLSAQDELSAALRIQGSVMEPVVDGTILPQMPIEAVRRGSAGKIPILVGTNLEEARFMLAMNPAMNKIDADGLVRRWQEVLPAEMVPGLIEGCRIALAHEGRPNDPPEIAIALQTDRQFRIPAVRLAEAQSGHNPNVYNYVFDWKSPMQKLGACHALEVGFVFGNLYSKFNGSGPKADSLAGKIQDSWIAFARTGNPSCFSLGQWPQYGAQRQTMILGEKCHVEKAPYEEERLAWTVVPDKYLG
jgi:para-nitrobenzyl esterase